MSKYAKQQVKDNDSVDDVPYKKGSYDPSYIYEAKSKDGVWRKAKIIEVKLLENQNPNLPYTPSSYRYYVHFLGFNRRMDDWITFENLKKSLFTIDDLKNSGDDNKK